MKKIFILLFLMLSNMIISSENYIVGNEIIFKAKNESEFKLIEYPSNTRKVYKNFVGKEFTFIPEVVGTYILEINMKNEKILKEIEVISKEEYKENEIYDIIERAFFNRDFESLENSLNILYVNNPKNSLIKSYIKRYIEYLIDTKDKKSAYELYNLFSKSYKLSQLENIEILEKIYTLVDNIKLEELDLKILEKLAGFNDVYTVDFAITSLLLEYNLEENLEFLKQYYKVKKEKKVAGAIADYYLRNNMFIESEIYLRNSDLKKLLIEYLKKENRDAFTYLYNNALENEDKIYINSLLEDLEKEKLIENYYEQAINNYNIQRYQLADLYFTRVIEQSKDDEILKKALYRKAKLYLDDKKYEESLKLFEAYMEKYGSIKEVEAKYSLGIIYYNLKKIEKSDKIFSQIIDLYPGTVWSTRASIYKLQIENKGENNES